MKHKTYSMQQVAHGMKHWACRKDQSGPMPHTPCPIPHASRRGQALIEVIIGMAIGSVLLGAAAVAIAALLFISSQARNVQTAVNLATELSNNLQGLADGDWHNIDGLTYGSSTHYWLGYGTSSYIAIEGEESVLGNEVASGLVAHWKFDQESGTTVYDVSGNANNGSFNGASLGWNAAQLGQGLDIDTVGDYVDLGTSSDLGPTSTFTISAWVRRDGFQASIWDVVYAAGSTSNNYWFIAFASNNILSFVDDAGGGAASTITVPTGEWHHITVTKNGNSGTSMNFYLDGTLRSTASVGTIQTAGTKTVGIRLEQPLDTFNGIIDDLRLYNRALSATEVSQLYSSTVFTRYFYAETVGRSTCVSGGITSSAVTACSTGPGASGVMSDPSTRELTSAVTWPRGGNGVSISKYVERLRHRIYTQTDWSGGNGLADTYTDMSDNRFTSSSNISASGTAGSLLISGSSPYPTSTELTSAIFDTQSAEGAAIHTIMWLGDKPAGTNVNIHFSSSNCTNGSPFSDCSNEAADNGYGPISTGAAYRYAWNEVLGWLDFAHYGNVVASTTSLSGYASSSAGQIALDCSTSPIGNMCATSTFSVARSGDVLSGYGWNDMIGWISFNCSNPGVCGTSNYRVEVSSSTGRFTGYAWNDEVGWLSFNCDDPGICATSQYQVKVLGSISSDWAYRGPDGSSATYYTPSAAGVQALLNPNYHNNHRYFRYKLFLQPNGAQTATPRVDDVIVGWGD